MKTLLVISISILAIASTCFALPDAEDCQKASESGIILYDCQEHNQVIIYNINNIVINPNISKHKHKEKHISDNWNIRKHEYIDKRIYKYTDNWNIRKHEYIDKRIYKYTDKRNKR